MQILALRGLEVGHEAVRDWEVKLPPVMGDALRKRRHGRRRGCGSRCYVDETYLKVRARWCYLYRAVGRDANLIEAMLSEHCEMKAAKAVFRSAKATMGLRPDRVTRDGHGSYPRTIRSVLGRTVRHRTSATVNNRPEQDHRGIKGRIRCMRGFKSHDAATASAASTVNSGISSVLVAVTTRSSPPSSAASTSQETPALRLGSCRRCDPTGRCREQSELWRES